ncbi:hypothetical protein D187_006095 [Cystobacter fuscus DSM 2262]|uniref:Uncharacterized protein n=2 Tax=Cystobacter fuscus TaxID=43 RepID=S9PL08_CYSF2|nr:hypothetical protein D187_006095 [Cystobacter fuscus DSM 2262]
MGMTTPALARGAAPAKLRRVGADPLRQSMLYLAHLLPERADATVMMDFLEDDLREGLDALSDVEAHFTELLEALRPEAVCPRGLIEAGDDLLVQERLELLMDVVMRLRRRLSQAAGLMRQTPTT